MGFLDRLFGDDERSRQSPPVPERNAAPGLQPPRSDDEIAIERYRYLLRTAPPETIEQVHAEAFAKLTDAQRQQVLADLSAGLPEAERPRSADPGSLARAATRGEYTQPGFMERTLGSPRQGGPSFGSMVGSSILGTVAGYVIGSALVSSFLAPTVAYDQGQADGGTDASAGDSSAGADAAGGDGWGGDAGGFGGDLGGDFGGDFGF